jgi:hypothetical protein
MNKILNFSKNILIPVGEKLARKVRTDAFNGIFQNETKNQSYKSSQYAKYKANSMQKFGRGKAKVGAGEKLKGFYAKSTNTESSFVNLHLTNKMMQSLSANQTKTTNNKLVISFEPEETMKVIGNRDKGYDVTTLNNENQEIVLSDIVRLLDKNIQEWARTKVTIRVGT